MNKGLKGTKNSSVKQKDSRHLGSNAALSSDSKSQTNQVFNLQKTAGNQAVQGLLKSGVLQPKLKIGQPGDKYEMEADRMAEQVMRMPDSVCPTCVEKKEEKIQRKPFSNQDSTFVQRDTVDEERKKREEEIVQTKPISGQITPLVQRQVEDVEKKKREEEMFQAKEDSGGLNTTADIDSNINNLRGKGEPLPETARNYFEPRFGYDFSGVRIHTGDEAAKTAKSINARAFTVGNDVILEASNYSPETGEGKKLLAHELTHAIQQSNSSSFHHVQRQPDKEKEPPLLDYDRIANQVYNAISGAGTEEEELYLALQKLGRNGEAIKKLKEVYSNKYGETLVSAIKGDLSGGELEYALQLINMGTKGAAEVIGKADKDEASMKAAAKRLREAVEGGGTEEEIIFAVLLPFNRNVDQIKALKKAYADEYKEDLRDRLASEMGGTELDYALYLLGEGPKGLNIKYGVEYAEQVLSYIKSEAEKKAKSPPSIDPGSNFYKRLKDKYLKDYLANPTEEEGKKAVEKIGRKMEGRKTSSGAVEVKPEGGAWRPAENRWEKGAIVFWNKEALPELPAELKDLPLFKNIKTLPKDLSAATDILIKENVTNLPYLDVPFLVGKPNTSTADLMADVKGGGKNISQLMHWATGVKYSDNSPQALRELFLAYEIWHLEGWDIFGQDPINDLIAEEQGRLLGTELRKGGSGAIKDEATLLAFLNESFLESRAWVGSLLRMRRAELDSWILAEEQKPGKMHWHEDKPLKLWPYKTVAQMLAGGMSIDDVKKSGLVKSQIEIYTLIYEADEWEKTKGPIELTDLQKALVQGKLDALMKVMAKGSGASIGEMKDASVNVEKLKKGEKGEEKKEVILKNPAEIEIPFPIGCFRGDTKILCANSSWKRIDKIKPGDKIISFNEDLQSTEICAVEKVHKRDPQPYLRIEVGNSVIINVTPQHNLYVNKSWLKADSAKAGDKLLYYDISTKNLSDHKIISIKEKSTNVPVYDLTVQKCNNYFAEGILAHNKIY